MDSTITAAILGLIEGLTEFLPVSSTGHILLAGHFLGFVSPGRTFEVVIQLGAVLAILTVYAARLWAVFATARTDPKAFRFIMAVLIAFLPAAFAGILAHDFIKTILFESPRLIAVMLIAGGVILLLVDRFAPVAVYDEAMEIPLKVALKIGFFQCLALVPGVSRSGATIVGALMMGVSKRTAAEFSFFLSMPTMGGAFAYDLLRNWDALDTSALTEIGIGFGVAFVTAVVVVRGLLNFIGRHGYAVFGWWRIGVGSAALIALSAGF